MDTGEMTAKGVPNRRKQAKNSTRQAVIDAGRTIFMEGGYEDATIRSIAKRIRRPDKPDGMSTGAVFANFDSKADLLLTIVQEELDTHGKLLERTVSEGGKILDCVVRICGADFGFFKSRLHLMEALARLETLTESEAVDPQCIAKRARSLTLSRRMRVWTPIHACLELLGSTGFESIAAQARLVTSFHLHACREAALEGQGAQEYQNALAKDLALAFFRGALN